MSPTIADFLQRISPPIFGPPCLVLGVVFFLCGAIGLMVNIVHRARLKRILVDGPVCPKCHYALRGAISPTCPECGHDLNQDGPLKMPARCVWPWISLGYAVFCYAIAPNAYIRAAEHIPAFVTVSHQFSFEPRQAASQQQQRNEAVFVAFDEVDDEIKIIRVTARHSRAELSVFPKEDLCKLYVPPITSTAEDGDSDETSTISDNAYAKWKRRSPDTIDSTIFMQFFQILYPLSSETFHCGCAEDLLQVVTAIKTHRDIHALQLEWTGSVIASTSTAQLNMSTSFDALFFALVLAAIAAWPAAFLYLRHQRQSAATPPGPITS